MTHTITLTDFELRMVKTMIQEAKDNNTFFAFNPELNILSGKVDSIETRTVTAFGKTHKVA